MAQQPGWYDDPSTMRRFRWWDGERWTRWVATSRSAPPPPTVAEGVVPVLTHTDKVLRWLRLGTLVLVLLLALLAGLGIWINSHDAQPPEPALPAKPAVEKLVAYDFGDAGGTVTIGDIGTAPLPGVPFQSAAIGPKRDGLFQKSSVATAPGTGGGGPDSTVTIGLTAEGLMHTAYGDANAGIAAVEMAERAWGDPKHKATIGTTTTRAVTIGTRKGWSADVPVTATPGGRKVTLTVRCTTIALDSKNWFLWCHVPGGAESAAAKTAADASLKGIRFTG